MSDSRHSSRVALLTVFLAVLIDLMGFGIVLPLLAFYASIFQASAVEIGLLYSIYSFAQLIFSPIWGGLSDRFGRRPIMLISTLGASFAYLIFGLAHTLSLLFISRLIAGIMGGNISTAQAYVADVTTHEDRAKGMGLIGAAFGIGFVIGPAVGALLIHPSFLKLFHIVPENEFALPGFFASTLSFISFLLVLFKLPETVNKEKNNGNRIVKSGVFTKTFWQFISGGKRFFPLLVLSMFLLSFAQASLYSSFPLFCKNQLNLSAGQVGMLFVYMGLIAVVIQGGLIKTLTKKFSEEKLFLLGSILMTIGLALIPFAYTKSSLILVLGIMSIGGSLNGPTLNSLISKEAEPDKVGVTMGTSQGIGSLGRVIGPTWGGFLYEIWFRLPFILTAAFLFLTVLVGLKLKRRLQESIFLKK
ncbi:MAG: MFS transporter [Candidatus Omnitrophica bacterium]|nr:MFS transporter [Candidatus Omnitrophota bacterium]